MFGIYSMNSFEMLLWTAMFYVLVVLLESDEPRLWLLFGLLAGLGLLNKHTTVLLGAAVAFGVLLSPVRKTLCDTLALARGRDCGHDPDAESLVAARVRLAVAGVLPQRRSLQERPDPAAPGPDPADPALQPRSLPPVAGRSGLLPAGTARPFLSRHRLGPVPAC